MSGTKYQHKLILQTLSFLFLLSTIGKFSKFSVEDSEMYHEEVNDDDDDAEYRRAAYDGDQVQLSRRAKVIRSCLWRAGHGVITPMNPYFASKFYPASMTLDEKKHVGWCRIAEVDTAAWSLLFLLKLEVPVTEIKNAVAIKKILKQKLDMRPRKRKTLMEQGKNDFNLIIVVRHPFLRLVDAYRNNIESNSSDFEVKNFAEFVDTLIRTPPNLMDKHWAPYSKVS